MEHEPGEVQVLGALGKGESDWLEHMGKMFDLSPLDLGRGKDVDRLRSLGPNRIDPFFPPWEDRGAVLRSWGDQNVSGQLVLEDGLHLGVRTQMRWTAVLGTLGPRICTVLVPKACRWVPLLVLGLLLLGYRFERQNLGDIRMGSSAWAH